MGGKGIPVIIKTFPIIVAGASFVQPGLGQILCGRIKRGIMFLFPFVIVYLLYFVSETSRELGQPILSWAYWHATLLITQVAVRIWSVYDAYRLSSTLNHENE